MEKSDSSDFPCIFDSLHLSDTHENQVHVLSPGLDGYFQGFCYTYYHSWSSHVPTVKSRPRVSHRKRVAVTGWEGSASVCISAWTAVTLPYLVTEGEKNPSFPLIWYRKQRKSYRKWKRGPTHMDSDCGNDCRRGSGSRAGLLPGPVCLGGGGLLVRAEGSRWRSRGARAARSRLRAPPRLPHTPSRLCHCSWAVSCATRCLGQRQRVRVSASLSGEKSAHRVRVCERMVIKLHMVYGGQILFCRIYLLRQSWPWNVFLWSQLVDFCADVCFCQFQVTLRDLFSRLFMNVVIESFFIRFFSAAGKNTPKCFTFFLTCC